jgi:hypothetical protein
LGYSLEYLPLVSLSDLFVFGRLPASAWECILRSCGEFLDAAARVPPPGRWNARAAESLYLHKTLERMELYARDTGISLDKPWCINGKPVPARCYVDVLPTASPRYRPRHSGASDT